jgi:carbamoyl-phosphate synthase large subunit
MPKDLSIKSVLIIGQDHCYCIKHALIMQDHNHTFQEEGIEVILINSKHITDSMADHIYLKPLTTKSISEKHPQMMHQSGQNGIAGLREDSCAQ